ncbi:MAG: hypothetical protein ACQERV_08585 [Bacteroidota bacterium]
MKISTEAVFDDCPEAIPATRRRAEPKMFCSACFGKIGRIFITCTDFLKLAIWLNDAKYDRDCTPEI